MLDKKICYFCMRRFYIGEDAMSDERFERLWNNGKIPCVLSYNGQSRFILGRKIDAQLVSNEQAPSNCFYLVEHEFKSDFSV